MNAYVHVYSWAEIQRDAWTARELLCLLLWALNYPPMIFWEMHCVLLLHFNGPALERYCARAFVQCPCEKHGARLRWVQRNLR